MNGQAQPPVAHRYSIRTVERSLLGGIGAYLYPPQRTFRACLLVLHRGDVRAGTDGGDARAGAARRDE